MWINRAALVLGLASFWIQQALSIVIPVERAATELLPKYDYIIVGGGLSGLVVGNRLSEDPNVTVLILEAGELDNRTEYTTYPAYIGREITNVNGWTLATTPQDHLDHRSRPYPQGRGVGGGTLIHGMTETYTLGGLDEETARSLGIYPDMSFHGTSGPVEVSFPRFVYNQSYAVLKGYKELGLPMLKDMNTGITAGVVFSPSSMQAINQSRCDARVAYLDPVMERPNMHVAVGQMATRLLLVDSTQGLISSTKDLPTPKRVQEVEFLPRRDSHSNNIHSSRVSASREVIMASGAIHTPTILQVSGIGPAYVLERLNITVQIELPGVGNNLQDHGMVGKDYDYKSPNIFTDRHLDGAKLAEAELLYKVNRTGPLTAPLISIVAFPSLQALTAEWNTLTGKYMLENFDRYLPDDAPPAVRQGYAKQSRLQLDILRQVDEPASEIMVDSTGRYTVAIQSTMSRGTVRPSGPNILKDNKPVIDPRYCAHPLDCEVAMLSFRMNARLMKTNAFIQGLSPSPSEPFASADDVADEENTAKLADFIQRGLGTEFHPAGTTAMLPFEDGGVVDTELRVYGTTNLRVVDAGIMPLLPAAHIQAAVYAVAEKAADLIKAVQG
ncbi:hypothetical protein MCOR27_001459 [Pyricularia oryzae]|nr:hypothetical protein MCOR02_002283 [Pyricularia oryzae]KAI6261607.1 hypothetical protein MCOR19_002176 [Pyricularia oryzae]KAI6287284.1 hypothetical protein MCOR27_001459 [Pyricularia oryzae]KAI6345498.1 hypothetical protein MCOR28_003567 [Pyricularia oryzae]KAI6372205.1 hypothetical protein MCOR31_003747 [Pyricularia oryzae]